MRSILVSTKPWDYTDLSLGRHHQAWASTALQNSHTRFISDVGDGWSWTGVRREKGGVVELETPKP